MRGYEKVDLVLLQLIEVSPMVPMAAELIALSFGGAKVPGVPLPNFPVGQQAIRGERAQHPNQRSLSNTFVVLALIN